jgi:uncharacterized protein (TIGR03067 family)
MPNSAKGVVLMPRARLSGLLVVILVLISGYAVADGDMDRFQGKWRVVELTDNGRSVPQDTIATWLPSGGRMEIVDNTILFNSPLNGRKHAKVFALDPTGYPKTILVQTGQTVDGTGVYRFDGERLVICVSNPTQAQRPTDFSAREGSNCMLMVLERDSDERGMQPISGQLQLAPPPVVNRGTQPETSAPANPAPSSTNPAPNPPANEKQTPPVNTAPIIVVNAPASNPTPTAAANPIPNPPAAPATAAARVLTDAEVTAKLVGTWKLNDGLGLLFLTFTPQGTFQSHREVASASTFHQVFMQSPVSSGTWSVANGQLKAHVTASVQVNKVNHVLTYSIRSISDKDFIWVDYMGRVGQAIKVQ